MGCIESRESSKPKKNSVDFLEITSTEASGHELTTLDTDFDQDSFLVNPSVFAKSNRSEYLDIYEELETIGSGFYGSVRKVRHRVTNTIRASKTIKKAGLSCDAESKLLVEVDILDKLDHPNILRIFEMFQERRRYYIISEYLQGEDLYSLMKKKGPFSEAEAAQIMQQVLSAVAYCHRNNIVHRDVKAENLIYESKEDYENLKLIDFGCAAKIKGNKKIRETVGTAIYIAPEVIKDFYSSKCDVWSCGVILFMLLTGGIPPFDGDNDFEILQKVKKGKFEFDAPLWEFTSPHVKRLISKMLEFDQDKRISAQEALDDPWFKLVLPADPLDVELAELTLRRLSSSKFESKLQETTLVFLVNYFSTKEEREMLLKSFHQLDTHNYGQLSRDELVEGYMMIMGMDQEHASMTADAVLKHLDVHKNGSVDYSTFISSTISRKSLLTRERLELAFKMFDKKNKGKITADELKKMFAEEEIKHIPQCVWQDWIDQVDVDHDGGIDLEEFCQMMMKLKDE